MYYLVILIEINKTWFILKIEYIILILISFLVVVFGSFFQANIKKTKNWLKLLKFLNYHLIFIVLFHLFVKTERS